MRKIKSLLKRIANLANNNKILVIILIVAALLRFIGTNPGYNQYHPDQGISYSAASSMVKNGNFDPLRYDYPALVPDINYIFFKLVFIPLNWIKYYLTHIPEIIDGVVHIPIAPLEEKTLFQTYVLGDRAINALFWSRYITAFFGVCNVLLVYILAKKIFEKIGPNSKYIGLIAAFLLTFNYKHVVNSHIGLPDIYNAFFLLLSLLSNINLWKNPSFKNYILAGIAVGLSFSVKYQIFALFPLLLTHLYLSFSNRRINLGRLLNYKIFICLALIPLVFALTNPYFFIHFEKALKAVRDVSQKYGMGTNKLNLYPIWYMYNVDYGLPILLAITLGIVLAVKRFFKQSLFLLSIILPFVYVFFYYSIGGFYVRNLITITPIFFIFAAFFFWLIFEKLAPILNKNVALFLVLAILLLAVYLPGRNSIINSYYYTKGWGYDALKAWVSSNFQNEFIVAAHPFDFSKGILKNNRTEFEIDGAFALNEHKENGAEYALINLDWGGNTFYFWMNFGPQDLKKYWNKPYEIMRNTYHGIAAEELFRYQIFSTLKPWQAPDSALILAKIPNWPKTEMVEIESFKFNEGLENWTIFGSDVRNEFEFDSSDGYLAKGSIVLLNGVDKGIRIVSPLVAIKPGFVYSVSGYLKSENILESRQRDGFLRIDFYQNKNLIGKLGLSSTVSSRVFGSADWMKREITVRAPDSAKFMTISFSANHANKIWLDDIIVEESKFEVGDITANPPYIKREVDLNLLYPNSHGNL